MQLATIDTQNEFNHIQKQIGETSKFNTSEHCIEQLTYLMVFRG